MEKDRCNTGMKRVSRIGACIRRRRRHRHHQPRRFIVSHCHNRARNFDNSGDIGVATISITRFFFFFLVFILVFADTASPVYRSEDSPPPFSTRLLSTLRCRVDIEIAYLTSKGQYSYRQYRHRSLYIIHAPRI